MLSRIICIKRAFARHETVDGEQELFSDKCNPLNIFAITQIEHAEDENHTLL